MASAKGLTVNVRLGGALSSFVSENIGETGTYDNVSEYVRDLIRKDKDRTEAQLFERLKAEVQHAFAAPSDTYVVVTAEDIITRNRGSSAIE